jgi:phosphoribosyl-ATP pyrophosphohydrolase
MASSNERHVLDRLHAVIAGRTDGDPEASYTARLIAAGGPAIARKLGEEAIETVIARLDGAPGDLVRESADLLYHLLVLWAEAGVAPEDVWAELARREGVSGLAEKASRTAKD